MHNYVLLLNLFVLSTCQYLSRYNLIYVDRQKYMTHSMSYTVYKIISLVRGEIMFVFKHRLLLSNDSEIVLGGKHLINAVKL